MSEHDWSQYEQSPGRGRQGWMVIKRYPDGTADEAYVLMDKRMPVEVQRVSYGPRGGVNVHAGGNVDSMSERAVLLRQLSALARELEAVRR